MTTRNSNPLSEPETGLGSRASSVASLPPAKRTVLAVEEKGFDEFWTSLLRCSPSDALVKVLAEPIHTLHPEATKIATRLAELLAENGIIEPSHLELLSRPDLSFIKQTVERFLLNAPIIVRITVQEFLHEQCGKKQKTCAASNDRAASAVRRLAERQQCSGSQESGRKQVPARPAACNLTGRLGVLRTL